MSRAAGSSSHRGDVPEAASLRCRLMRLVAVESAARRACDVVSEGVACSVITTAPPHRSSGAQAGRNGWFGGELCSGAPIADPVPRRLVSANFENASRIRAFGSVRIFGHDGVSSLHLPQGRLNPPSRSDTYSSSAGGLLRFYHREARRVQKHKRTQAPRAGTFRIRGV